MKRGVVTLTKNEIQQAYNFVSQHTSNELLINKLKSALNETELAHKIQFSNDEVELILDLMPAPTMDNTVDSDIQKLRKSLTNFLSQLNCN